MTEATTKGRADAAARPNPLFDLTGKVALVTGGAIGLGFGMAKGLARAGATVVINGRDPAKLEKAAAEVEAEGLNFDISVFDVTQNDQIDKAVGELEARHGGIHILLNNAGQQYRKPLEDMDDEGWKRVLDVNLDGVFRVTRRAVRGMIERKSGKIVNTCSLTSEFARAAGVAPYASSKGAVKMLTRAMACEWAKYNIQANGIGPGFFPTELNKALLTPEFEAWMKQRTPAARWGHPDDLAGTAVFLSSPASDFMTGQVLYVDGGITASL